MRRRRARTRDEVLEARATLLSLSLVVQVARAAPGPVVATDGVERADVVALFVRGEERARAVVRALPPEERRELQKCLAFTLASGDWCDGDGACDHNPPPRWTPPPITRIEDARRRRFRQ